MVLLKPLAQALADGDLQANSFQHQPYLDNQIADRKFDLVSVGTTITTPMGVYSKKVKNLDELKDGATIGIPNDPTNGGRALLVLASKGVLKVKEEAGLKVTPADITEKEFTEMFAEFGRVEAALQPRLKIGLQPAPSDLAAADLAAWTTVWAQAWPA